MCLVISFICLSYFHLSYFIVMFLFYFICHILLSYYLFLWLTQFCIVLSGPRIGPKSGPKQVRPKMRPSIISPFCTQDRKPNQQPSTRLRTYLPHKPRRQVQHRASPLRAPITCPTAHHAPAWPSHQSPTLHGCLLTCWSASPDPCTAAMLGHQPIRGHPSWLPLFSTSAHVKTRLHDFSFLM